MKILKQIVNFFMKWFFTLQVKNPIPEGTPSKYVDTDEIEYTRYWKIDY
jgi:hypothetical protein